MRILVKKVFTPPDLSFQRGRPKRSLTGFTLIEILISVLIFTLVLAALLSSMAATLHLIEVSRARTIAISDLRDMMEEIRVTPFSDMLALFPDSVVDGPASKKYQSIVGGYELINEHIIVNYADQNVEPLEVAVSLSWQDKLGRTYSASLSTFKAR
ncbi:prepilin-type N-terminal cleavage/methylation domain-containing protein [Candidatus Omnitrophota bacterium]